MHVFMVVYVDVERDCIAHACYLIQLDKDTFLTPSLYVTSRDSYKSFIRLPVENNHFSDIRANRFEVHDYNPSKPLERGGRLSNDNGETWTRFKLTFSPETMTPALTLIPSDQKP
jgi:hypothetical protein